MIHCNALDLLHSNATSCAPVVMQLCLNACQESMHALRSQLIHLNVLFRLPLQGPSGVTSKQISGMSQHFSFGIIKGFEVYSSDRETMCLTVTQETLRRILQTLMVVFFHPNRLHISQVKPAILQLLLMKCSIFQNQDKNSTSKQH